MYSVSDKYLEAFRKPYRTDRITGRIKLKDGTNIVLSDEILVQNKFTITRKVCGTAFDVGTFFAGDIALSIRSDDAKELDFGSAVLAANYEIVTGGTKDEPIWEEVPLGVFYIDGQRTTRRGQTLNLRGYDSTAKFDVDLPLLTAVTTLWDALVQACLKANVGLAVSEAWFKSLPNASVVPDFTSKQIQSCRDLVMWIAQTVGCYAYIDRNGFLQIKRYYYAGDGTFDRAILATERTKIEYTDTRTYLAYLTSYSENTPKLYQDIKQWDGSDIIKEGGLSLPNNPLLKALSAEQQDEVNMALMENSSYPTRYIKSQGFIDPAIDLLDVLAFVGGTIDIGQIISVCSEIKWKFRGQGHIVCNNLDQYSEDAELADAIMADDTAAEQSNDLPVFSPVKSQVEKRIDALEAGGNESGGTAEKLKTTSDALTVQTANNEMILIYEGFGGFNGPDARVGNIKCTDYEYLAIRFDPYGDLYDSASTYGELRLYESRVVLWSTDYMGATSSSERNANMFTVDTDSVTADFYYKCGDVYSNEQFTIKPEAQRDTGIYGIALSAFGQIMSFREDGIYINGKKILMEE